MVPDTSECLFRAPAAGSLSRLRQALVAAGFSKAAFAELNKHGVIDLQVLIRMTAGDSQLHHLMRLFRLAQPISAEAACSALAPAGVAELVELGLLRQMNGQIVAQSALTPEDSELYLAHDFDPMFTGEESHPYHVLEAGPSSQLLSALTIRRNCGDMLDLCAGAGIQSLLASQHSGRVIATDINRRALNFGEFNARLNGVCNVEFRQGHLYGPVGGEHFDLVVANPPYIVSPGLRYVYRDSGLPGDTICEQVIREAPSHLREGGFAIVLFNWHHRTEDDWRDRPLSWAVNSDCDVWLLRLGTQLPAPYAFRWLRHGEGRGGADIGQLLDQWLAYYEAMGIELFSFGLLILRRRSARPNWIRSDTLRPEWTALNCSDQILRIFAAQDFLEDVTGDDDFLDSRFTLAPDHEMQHILRAEDGRWVVTSAALKQTRGFEFMGRVDPNVISVLGGCDGDHTLRQLLSELSRHLGVDFSAVAPVGLEVMRSLMRSGFLIVPAHRCFVAQKN